MYLPMVKYLQSCPDINYKQWLEQEEDIVLSSSPVVEHNKASDYIFI